MCDLVKSVDQWNDLKTRLACNPSLVFKLRVFEKVQGIKLLQIWKVLQQQANMIWMALKNSVTFNAEILKFGWVANFA